MPNYTSMNEKRFSISDRLKSFVFAFAGMKALLKLEHNSRIHLFATVAVLFLSIQFHLSAMEWISILFAIGFVWVTEIINTCIERIMDLISTEHHPAIGRIKDMAAAAVLIASLLAIITGLTIFIPKFISS